MTLLIQAIIIGLLTGLVTGLITNYWVTRHFRAIDQRIFVMGVARDLAQECHTLLDLTNRLIEQIALRKYRAYEIIQVLSNFSGEEKRRTRNKMAMDVGLGEVHKATLERLCLSIHTKQLEKRLQPTRGILLDVVKRMNDAVGAAEVLWSAFSSIIDFHTYINNVEHMHDMTFEDFIKRLEEEEYEAYKQIPTGRDKLNRALLDLVAAIGGVAST